MTMLTIGFVAVLLVLAGGGGWMLGRRGGAAPSDVRIRAGLDATSANIVIADENLDIVYVNRTVEAMRRPTSARHCRRSTSTA
jgi:hypothetical protein